MWIKTLHYKGDEGYLKHTILKWSLFVRIIHLVQLYCVKSEAKENSGKERFWYQGHATLYTKSDSAASPNKSI